MEQIHRESFVFYRSFYEAMQDLPDNDKLAIYNAICEYSLNNQELEIKGISKGMFQLIKPQLDANNKRYANGKKGGRPQRKESKGKPNNNQDVTETKPNDNVNVNVNVNVNDNENENEKIEKRNTLTFGEFKHVELTQEEFETLSSSVSDVDLLISFLDEYLEINPKKEYANHFLVLKNKFPMEEYKKEYPYEVVANHTEADIVKNDAISEEDLEEILRKYD